MHSTTYTHKRNKRIHWGNFTFWAGIGILIGAFAVWIQHEDIKHMQPSKDLVALCEASGWVQELEEICSNVG